VLLSRLTEFIQLHENYKQIETDEFDFEIPDPNKLLTSIQLKEYSSLTDKLANGSFPKDVTTLKFHVQILSNYFNS
jgi:hypothetical protein